jgi:PAS domain S-box-containing protein
VVTTIVTIQCELPPALYFNQALFDHQGTMKKEKTYRIPSHVTEIILESISDGVFTVDHDWRITSFNQAAERITRIPREEALGKHCWEVFRSNMCETDCALRRTMKLGKAFVDTSTYIVDIDKRRIPVVVSTSLLKDSREKVLGGVETFRDMSVAVKTLGAAGVEVFAGQNGTVSEAIERYKNGNLESTRKATVADHHGMGGGSSTGSVGTGDSGGFGTGNMASGSGVGMGRGRGGGRGRGMGGGRMQGRN